MTASFGLDIHCMPLPLAEDEFTDLLPVRAGFSRTLLVVRVAPYLALTHPDDVVAAPFDDEALYRPWEWSSLEAAGSWSVWSVGSGGATQVQAFPTEYALKAEEQAFCQALRAHAPVWAETMKEGNGFVAPFVARVEPRDGNGDLNINDPTWSPVHPERKTKFWCDALIGAAGLSAPIPYGQALNLAACILVEQAEGQVDPLVAAPTFTVLVGGSQAKVTPSPPAKPLDPDAQRWVTPLTLDVDGTVHEAYALIDPAETLAVRYNLDGEDETSCRIISPTEMWIAGSPAARAALEGGPMTAAAGGGGADAGGYEPAAIGEAIVAVADLGAAIRAVDDLSDATLDWHRAVLRDLAHSGMIGDREGLPPALDYFEKIRREETDDARQLAIDALALRLSAVAGVLEARWLSSDGLAQWTTFLENTFEPLKAAMDVWNGALNASDPDPLSIEQGHKGYRDALLAISPSNRGMLARLIHAQWQEALYERDNVPRRFLLTAGTTTSSMALFAALDPTRKAGDDFEGGGPVGWRGVLEMREEAEFRVLVEGAAGEFILDLGEGAFQDLASPPAVRLAVKATMGAGAGVQVDLGGVLTNVPLVPAASDRLWIAFRWSGNALAIGAGGSAAVGTDPAAMTPFVLSPRGDGVMIASAASGAIQVSVDTVTAAAALPTAEELDAVPTLTQMWRDPLARWLSAPFVDAVSSSNTGESLQALRDGAVAAANVFVAERVGGGTWGPSPGKPAPNLAPWFERQADIAFDQFRGRRAGSLETRRASPIRLRIDQPAKLANDLWNDFSGVGVLVGRTEHDAAPPTQWRSLCPATLQVGSDGALLGIPVFARPVVEILGLRTFFIEYNNRLLSSRAAHDPDINTSENQLTTVRAADPDRWVTPHLVFDTDQWFLLFLVGIGGTLPSHLRDGHPACLKTEERDGKVSVVADGAPGDMIRKVHYVRDVPISAPGGQDKATLPPHRSDGVSPLASELEDIGRPIQLKGSLNLFAVSDHRGMLQVANDQSLSVELFDLSLAHGDQLVLSLRGEPDPTDPALIISVTRAAATAVTVAGKTIDIEAGPDVRNIRVLSVPHRLDDKQLKVEVSEDADLRRDGDMIWNDTGSTDSVNFQELQNGILTLENHGARARLRMPRVTIGGAIVADALMSDALPETIVLGHAGEGSRVRSVSPPRVEFETLSRWVAAGLQNSATRANAQEALDKAFAARSSGAPDANELQPDPAVSRFFIDGEVIHSLATGVGRRGTVVLLAALRPALSFDLIPVAAADVFAIRLAGQRIEVDVPEGCIAELRIYGAIDAAAAARFDPAVVQTMRAERLADGSQVWLGAPQRYWLESPLDIGLDTYREAILAALIAEPEVRDRRRRAAIGLNPAVGSSIERHRTMFRAIGRFYVIPQRWSWRGRQLPILSSKSAEVALADPLNPWAKALFEDRRDDDHGPLVPGTFMRRHLERDCDRRALTSIDLGYFGSANLWRFGIELESRYRPLKPSDRNQRIRGGTLGKGGWLNHLVRADDVAAARPRQVPRPSIRALLPLTEALDIDGNVGTAPLPSIMVQLDHGWSAGDNIAEQLEVVVDIGIDPLKRNVDGNVILKQESGTGDEFRSIYQQVGPDDLLSAEGHTGELVPLAVDGPLGFSFDTVAGGTSGRRAAFLVSLMDVPALTHWKQLWPMARFSFRRIENPRLTAQPELTPTGTVFSFAEEAEAIELILDVPEAGETFQFTIMTSAGAAAILEVKVKPEDDGLHIESTLQGLRLPVAPEQGEAEEDEDTDPAELAAAGEAADLPPLPRLRLKPSRIQLSKNQVQVKLVFARQTGEKGAPLLHITPSFSDESSRLAAEEQGASGWRGGMSLPVGVLAVGIDVSKPTSSALPMRCSPFVASSWVQFTPDTSRFSAKIAGAEPVVLAAEALKVQLDGKALSLRHARDSRTIDRLTSVAEAGGGKVPRFRLFAAVSHWIADAGGRLVEQQVEVVELNAAGEATLSQAVPRRGGRVRVLSLMRTNDPAAQVPIVSPEALGSLLFGATPGIDEPHLRVIGMSRPLSMSGQ